MSFDREGPRRSPGYEASYRPAPAYSESREQKPPTLAEVAQHAVDGATRSVGGVGVELDRLHKAEQDRDPKSWTAVHRGLAQQIADARSAIAKARATLHEGGPDESAKLDAATHQLDQHEEAAKQLTTPPLAYKRLSREDQILAALQSRPAPGDAHAGFQNVERELKAEIQQLAPAEWLTLSARLARVDDKQSLDDPLMRDPVVVEFARLRSPRQAEIRRYIADPKERHQAAAARAAGPQAVPVSSSLDDGGAAEPDSVEAKLRRMIEAGDPDPELVGSLDGTTRRTLVRRLEGYRPGSGDELAARFTRLDRGARDRILDALRERGPRKLPDEIRGDLEGATGRSLSGVRVHDDQDGHATAASHGARAVAIGSDIHMGEGQLDPTSRDGRELLAHEVAHTVQADAHPGPLAAAAKRDGGSTEAAEVEADQFAADFVAHGAGAAFTPRVSVSSSTPLHGPPKTNATAATAPPRTTNYKIDSGGLTAHIEREWLHARPTDHWLEVLLAMQSAGAVPWAKPAALTRFASLLGERYALRDEVVTFHLDTIAVAIIGLPPDTAPQLERVGDDILIALPGIYSTGNNEQIPLDSHAHADRFDTVYRALAGFTGLPVRNRIELGTVGVSSTTGAVRLHDAELAQIFGADAWQVWKSHGEIEHARRQQQATSSTGAAGQRERTPEPHPAQPHAAEPHNDLSAEEQTRIARWFAAHGAIGHRFWTRDILAMLDELKRDPALADAVERLLADGALSGNQRALDEFTLREAIDRAKLERERARLGLGELHDDARQTDAAGVIDVPAKLVEHGLLLSGREAHFDLVLDWSWAGAVSDNQHQALAKRPWHAMVEWVFERTDVQGPANPDGRPIRAPDVVRTEYSTNEIGIDRTFTLEPHLSSGIWTVHAFLHTSHFAPKHVVATVEVKTESARMADLRRDAFGGMTPVHEETEAHHFDTGTWNKGVKLAHDSLGPVANARSLDKRGKDLDSEGTITHGDLPAGFRARGAEQRTQSRRAEIQRMEQLVEYLRAQKRPENTDAIAAAMHRLDHLREADKTIATDEQTGWQSFDLRGTYLSHIAEVPSGPLDLYGTVRHVKKKDAVGDVASVAEHVEVQIRDHTQRFSPENFDFVGRGDTFEAALEDAFVTLCKKYPEGRMSVLAQAMDASRANASATGKAVGFELATTSSWNRAKAVIYNPVVQAAVNAAAMALMIFQPELAPALMWILAIDNTIASVDQLVSMQESGTLTGKREALTLAQIGLNFLPLARGARLLQSGTGLFAFEAANYVGMAAVIAAQTKAELEGIQEGDIAALAERYRALIDLQTSTNPSDPQIATLRAEIDRGAEKIRARTMEVWTKSVAQNGAFLVGTHVLVDIQRGISGDAIKTSTPGRGTVGGESSHEPERSARHASITGVPSNGDTATAPPSGVDQSSVETDGRRASNQSEPPIEAPARAETKGTSASMPTSAEDASARKASGEHWSNKQVRDYYNAKNGEIPALNERWKQQGLTAEQRARKAYEIRHSMRMTTREMMGDGGETLALLVRDALKYGDGQGPTFEQLVEQYTRQGKTGDEAYEAIIAGAERTDRATNERVRSGGASVKAPAIPPGVVVDGDSLKIPVKGGAPLTVRIRAGAETHPRRIADGSLVIYVEKDAPPEIALKNAARQLQEIVDTPRQDSTNLDQLYLAAEVAQAHLAEITRAVATELGGRPLIPTNLKGRPRAEEKIAADYEGENARIVDLARSSIEFDNPQQIEEAIKRFGALAEVVRIKDRFKSPVNGYRDVTMNLRMPNGHIVEVQLHLKAILDVKNGPGHALYEELRTIEARAKTERRDLTPDEELQVKRLTAKMRGLYDQAYEKADTIRR